MNPKKFCEGGSELGLASFVWIGGMLSHTKAELDFPGLPVLLRCDRDQNAFGMSLVPWGCLNF